VPCAYLIVHQLAQALRRWIVGGPRPVPEAEPAGSSRD
jgi:hypothetical protein